MRHRVAHRKLGRSPSIASRCCATWPRRCSSTSTSRRPCRKAKELRPFVEQLITLAKRGGADGGRRPGAARAPARGARHRRQGRRSRSCSTRSRRGSPSGRAATSASCGSATAGATAPRWPWSSSSAASTTPRRPRPTRQAKAAAKGEGKGLGGRLRRAAERVRGRKADDRRRRLVHEHTKTARPSTAKPRQTGRTGGNKGS